MSQTLEQSLQATIQFAEGQSLYQSCGKMVEIVKQGPIFTFVRVADGTIRGVLNEYLTIYN